MFGFTNFLSLSVSCTAGLCSVCDDVFSLHRSGLTWDKNFHSLTVVDAPLLSIRFMILVRHENLLSVFAMKRQQQCRPPVLGCMKRLRLMNKTLRRRTRKHENSLRRSLYALVCCSSSLSSSSSSFNEMCSRLFAENERDILPISSQLSLSALGCSAQKVSFPLPLKRLRWELCAISTLCDSKKF